MSSFIFLVGSMFFKVVYTIVNSLDNLWLRNRCIYIIMQTLEWFCKTNSLKAHKCFHLISNSPKLVVLTGYVNTCRFLFLFLNKVTYWASTCLFFFLFFYFIVTISFPLKKTYFFPFFGLSHRKSQFYHEIHCLLFLV